MDLRELRAGRRSSRRVTQSTLPTCAITDRCSDIEDAPAFRRREHISLGWQFRSVRVAVSRLRINRLPRDETLSLSTTTATHVRSTAQSCDRALPQRSAPLEPVTGLRSDVGGPPLTTDEPTVGQRQQSRDARR